MNSLSLARIAAVFVKELQQMLRDRLTFAMAVGVPVLQLILFGYAINTDPKGLPMAVVTADTGQFGRSITTALQNSAYFNLAAEPASESEADAMLEDGRGAIIRGNQNVGKRLVVAKQHVKARP